MTTLTGSAGLIAKYLLHGDHTTNLILKGDPVARIVESHDAGTPHTTLMRGWACASYSFRMIDDLGVSASAE